MIVPPSAVKATMEWMVSAGWPKPEVFSAALTAEGVDWEGRREAQDAYEDVLKAVAFEASHPHAGRFDVPRVATLGRCAAESVGLALYLLEWTDQRPGGVAEIAGVDTSVLASRP